MTGKSKTGLVVAALLAAGALARPVMAADSSQTRTTGNAGATPVLAFRDQGAVSQPVTMNASEPTAPRTKSSAPHR
jgi:hypothetical protein